MYGWRGILITIFLVFFGGDILIDSCKKMESSDACLLFAALLTDAEANKEQLLVIDKLFVLIDRMTDALLFNL